MRRPKRSIPLSIACCFALILVLAAFSPAVSANTGTVHLSSAYDYRSVTYDTYVKWADDLYGDSVSYGLGSDSHINFTDFSMGSPNNPSWTFGVVSQNGNVTIAAIQTSYIRFSATAIPSSTFNMTFYFTTLPTYVYVAQPTNVTIPSDSFYTSYSQWASATSPSVYADQGLGYLMVKTTYATPTIQIETNGTTVASSSSTLSSVSSTTSGSTGTEHAATTSSSSDPPSTTSTSTSTAQGPQFDIALSPSSGRTNPGDSVTFRVTVNSAPSSTSPVVLSYGAASDGLQVKLGEATPAPDYNDTVTVSVPQDVPPGVYSVTVYGSVGHVQESASYELLVVQKEYLLQVAVSPAEGGTVSMLAGGYSIAAGSNITLSEQPSQGWSFSQWLVDGAAAGSSNTLSLQINSNTTVTAVFGSSTGGDQDEQGWYPVTIATTGAPYSMVVVDGVQYQTPVTFEWSGGSSHNISAVVTSPLSNSSDEMFESWSGVLSTRAPSVSLDVKGPAELTANYATRYAVNIEFQDESGQTINPYNASLYDAAGGQLVVPPSGVLWLQKGSYYVGSASWDGVELVQPGNYPEITVTGAATVPVALPVYDLRVTVQDIFGDPLSGATVTLSLPNGTQVTDVTGPTGKAYFQEVPAGSVQLASDYLGVSTSFTINPAQGVSPTLTVALSYPIFALLGLGAATAAIVTLKVRHKGPFHRPGR